MKLTEQNRLRKLAGMPLVEGIDINQFLKQLKDQYKIPDGDEPEDYTPEEHQSMRDEVAWIEHGNLTVCFPPSFNETHDDIVRLFSRLGYTEDQFSLDGHEDYPYSIEIPLDSKMLQDKYVRNWLLSNAGAHES